RAGQELRRARFDDRDAAQHLPHDDLDVLVVDRHALRAVDLLHLVDQVHLDVARTHDAQHLVRVCSALEQLLAHLDVVPVGQHALILLALGTVLRQTLTLGQLVVDHLVAAVVGRDGDGVEAVVVLDAHAARLLGDRRLALGHARLEQLLHARQTAGDVVTAGAALVERAHGQLGTGLTDRLRGDDADGLADVDQLAGGHRAAVALGADARAGAAGEHRADLDLRDTRGQELLDGRVAEVAV